MSTRDGLIEAAGLFTREGVRQLGTSLKNVYGVDHKPAFGDLLKALDATESGQPHAPPLRRDDDDAVRAWQRAFVLWNRDEK